MTNSGAREQLFYEAPRGNRITSIKTTDIEHLDWFTWTGVLGLVCTGIWIPATDVTDVNSTDLTKNKKILATGDDFGYVKLFDFPATVRSSFLSVNKILSNFFQGKFAKYKQYTGHSAHVTRVRWTHDSSYLVSIGGRDVAALIWKHEGPIDVEPTPGKTTVKNVRATPPITTTSITAAKLRPERGESDDSDNTDSEEEGYDSDVQHDRSMDYNLRILIDPNRLKSEKKEEIIRRTTKTNPKPM